MRVSATKAIKGWWLARPAFGRVVATCSAFLRTVAGHHGGIQIERDAIDGQLTEHPAVQRVHHRLIRTLRKLVEQPHDGLEVGHALKAKKSFQDWIMPGHFTMLKAIGTTPYREHELGDELFRAIASIATGLWHPGGRKGGLETKMIEHSFHQPHAAPSGDFFVGEAEVKFHHCPALKSRSLNLDENTLTVILINDLR